MVTHAAWPASDSFSENTDSNLRYSSRQESERGLDAANIFHPRRPGDLLECSGWPGANDLVCQRGRAIALVARALADVESVCARFFTVWFKHSSKIAFANMAASASEGKRQFGGEESRVDIVAKPVSSYALKRQTKCLACHAVKSAGDPQWVDSDWGVGRQRTHSAMTCPRACACTSMRAKVGQKCTSNARWCWDAQRPQHIVAPRTYSNSIPLVLPGALLEYLSRVDRQIRPTFWTSLVNIDDFDQF